MRHREVLKRLKDAVWLVTARRFFQVLDGAQGRTRAVGGIVRDTLLGIDRPDSDMDLATELTPDEVVARAQSAGISAYPTGIDHGTVTLVLGAAKVEVTTLRQDVETFGRHARVVFGTDWSADAQRRDFTMNALYCGMDGEVFDPLEGLNDCLERRVRFIGDADRRIAEDRLRVYRYFRFVASHGGQYFQPDALAACQRAAHTLDALSAERVGAEMMRLLAVSHCARTVSVMAAAGLPDARVFTNAAGALERLECGGATPTSEMRLAIAVTSGASLDQLCENWRLSNVQVQTVERLIAATVLARREAWGELAYRFPDCGLPALAVVAALDNCSRKWTTTAQSALARIGAPKFPLSGGDLLRLGYASGPALGAELKRLERLWVESGFSMGRDGLLEQATPPAN